MKHGKTLIGLAAVMFLWPVASGATAAEGGQAGLPFKTPDGVWVVGNQPASSGGWLGVQLAPVPAALASQLQLDRTGVMVRNIFTDSPADQAKLERYDVIVAVDGQPVDGGMEKFSRLVQSRKPGDRLELTLYRGGQKIDATVTLAAVPGRLDERALKYEDDPDVAARRLFGLRGKILRPGPEGWILDDLGELPELPGFEGWFERDDVGPGHDQDIEEGRRVDAEGRAIHVRKNRDGSIEVRRYKSGTPMDQAEAKVYDNMDQLREDDPEAAELLESPATRPAEPDGRQFGLWRRDMDRWRQDMRGHEDNVRRYQDSMRQYQDALREYMKRFRPPADPDMPAPPDAPKWREWRERFMPEPGLPSDRLMPRSPSAPPAPLIEPQPEARFELHPDGSITAHVDDGPTQLNLTFPNEETFEQKAPKLYERYRRSLDRTR